MKKGIILIALTLLLAMLYGSVPLLASSEPHHPLVVLDELLSTFSQTVDNQIEILPPNSEGNIAFAVMTGTGSIPFSGTIEATHVLDATNSRIAQLIGGEIVSTNTDFTFGEGGIATIEFAPDLMSVTIEMQHDVYWHDGVPLTLDDLVFAYEIIAHPDYTGPRFTSAHFFPIIVGVDEYLRGESDHIAGLALSNNGRTLVISYTEPLPPSAVFAGGIWLSPTPRHQFNPRHCRIQPF